MTTQITANNIVPGTITSTQLTPGSLAPRIYSVAICDSSYNVLDDTAANTTGGYIQVTGANFGSNSQIVINGSGTLSAAYVNNTTLRAQVGAMSTGTYTMYVVDTDTGATAIRVNAYTTSSFPAWGTASALSDQPANTSFGVSLSANSDSSITYANTTALPTGTTLLANGYFYGTVSIGVQTTYNFTVDAKDAENQDALRTFSMTVTVVPPTRLWAWGQGIQGILGTNDVVDRSSPVQVGAETVWSSISSSSYMTVATKNDGTLWTWGRNQYGGLGLNDTNYRSSPTQVGAGTTWNSVTLSYDAVQAVLATKTDGTLWAWGKNDYGQLGKNDTVYRSSPVQVGALNTWSKVTVGGTGTVHAIKTDGTLWAWGRNDWGQLGTNDAGTNPRSSPVQIGAGTTWSTVGQDNLSTLALKTDGTLWGWGRNGFGQLGLNHTNIISSPTQVGAGTNWLKIAPSYIQMMAIKTDGTLWTWGYNYNGELGQNNTIGTSSPIQVGSGTNWSFIANGYYRMAAIKTDGTLWTWGDNGTGQLGKNDVTKRSSPVQVGTNTNWSKVSLGRAFVTALTSN